MGVAASAFVPGQEVMKVWEFDVKGQRHEVILKHHSFTGSRTLVVDGSTIWSAIKFVDDGSSTSFDVGGAECHALIEVSSTEFVYKLLVNGEPVPDLSTQAIEYKEPNVKIEIPTFEVVVANSVALYHVKVQINDQEPYLIKRRFKDFETLNTAVRAFFASNHLLNNVPLLPTKYPKMLYDHFTQEFLQQRAQQLQEYMRKLVQVPKVAMNPELRQFLSPDVQSSALLVAPAAPTISRATSAAPAPSSSSASSAAAPSMTRSSTTFGKVPATSTSSATPFSKGDFDDVDL